MRQAQTANSSPSSLDLTPEPLAALAYSVRRVVDVRPDALEALLCALLAGGHVLIEGIPGTGKTLLSRTLARCFDLEFKRIQFTNDLMPSDVVGSSVWRADEGRFEFKPGPLFSNVVLADEINRTSSRTLSCLLEAMEEGAVTVDGENHRLGDPFLILATRNPIEFHGTFPIPEAALDRFLARIELGYPEPDAECQLYRGASKSIELEELEPVVDAAQLAELIAQVPRVHVSEPLSQYAYRVVQATRENPNVQLGISPRAAISWIQAARGRAVMQGRGHVLPDDLQALAQPVLGHRVFLHGGGDARELIADLIASTPVEL